MPILHDGSVFFHVPKTGGTWIRAMLIKNGLVAKEIRSKHWTPAQVDAADGLKGVKEPWKFCFVRRPTAMYESLWRHWVRRGWRRYGSLVNSVEAFDHPWAVLNTCRGGRFGEWVRKVLAKCPAYVTKLYALYTPEMDFVGKQEHLRADLLCAARIRGWDVDEEMIFDSRRRMANPGEVDWEPELKAEVEEIERAVYEEFGYEREA